MTVFFFSRRLKRACSVVYPQGSRGQLIDFKRLKDLCGICAAKTPVHDRGSVFLLMEGVRVCVLFSATTHILQKHAGENSNTRLPSQLFLSGASSYPGSQAHLKLPRVFTHFCSHPPLSGLAHSSSSGRKTHKRQSTLYTHAVRNVSVRKRQ